MVRSSFSRRPSYIYTFRDSECIKKKKKELFIGYKSTKQRDAYIDARFARVTSSVEYKANGRKHTETREYNKKDDWRERERKKKSRSALTNRYCRRSVWQKSDLRTLKMIFTICVWNLQRKQKSTQKEGKKIGENEQVKNSTRWNKLTMIATKKERHRSKEEK